MLVGLHCMAADYRQWAWVSTHAGSRLVHSHPTVSSTPSLSLPSLPALLPLHVAFSCSEKYIEVRMRVCMCVCMCARVCVCAYVHGVCVCLVPVPFFLLFNFLLFNLNVCKHLCDLIAQLLLILSKPMITSAFNTAKKLNTHACGRNSCANLVRVIFLNG